MNKSDLPAPLVPAEADLTGFGYMPLEYTRLRRSKLWLIAKRCPEIAFYAVNLWGSSWHELPAGSLEDDDDVLAELAMCNPEKWPGVREDVMRGWVKCSDGRLYHHVIAEKVLTAWDARKGDKNRTKAATAARMKQRALKLAMEAAAEAQQRDVVRDVQRDGQRGLKRGANAVPIESISGRDLPNHGGFQSKPGDAGASGGSDGMGENRAKQAIDRDIHHDSVRDVQRDVDVTHNVTLPKMNVTSTNAIEVKGKEKEQPAHPAGSLLPSVGCDLPSVLAVECTSFSQDLNSDGGARSNGRAGVGAHAGAPVVNPVDCPPHVSQTVWEAWTTQRAKDGSPVTPGVVEHAAREADKAGIELDDYLTDATDKATGYTTAFEVAWLAYPKRAGGNPKADALKAWKARIKGGVPPKELIDGVKRYAAYCKAAGTEARFVKLTSTFFGPSEHFKEAYALDGASGRRAGPAVKSPEQIAAEEVELLAFAAGRTGPDNNTIEGEALEVRHA